MLSAVDDGCCGLMPRGDVVDRGGDGADARRDGGSISCDIHKHCENRNHIERTSRLGNGGTFDIAKVQAAKDMSDAASSLHYILDWAGYAESPFLASCHRCTALLVQMWCSCDAATWTPWIVWTFMLEYMAVHRRNTTTYTA